MPDVVEQSYPISFREKDASTLGELLRNHDSVVLIGMKRVGISNFLRFFLYNKEIQKTYIKNGQEQLFVPIDLNDLVSLDIYAFWMLTLKRVVDTIQSSKLSEDAKKHSARLFLDSVQLKDHFVTLDSVQKAVRIIQNEGYYPTLFFIRFDRFKDAITTEFFANLQGLKDSAKHKLSFVFTSFRPLHELVPSVFTKSDLSVFSKDMYLMPSKHKDLMTIFNTLKSRYSLSLPSKVAQELMSLAGGHVQYLHLAVIKINEAASTNNLKKLLVLDEEIRLLGEEIFESFTKEEQEILLSREKNHYLENTGALKEGSIFSPLFEHYIDSRKPAKKQKDLTKKEHLLFSYLMNNVGELCERDDIVTAVWPEYKEYGVTDWAIDRLVARLRNKLKIQESPYKILTIITRGYKLVKQ